MKRFLLSLAIFSWAGGVNAQPPLANSRTKIYIVRHSEKESGKDPALTPQGRQRAGDLMRKLKRKYIRHIYVSEYRRTQMTADSMRIQLGIDTIHYVADTTGEDLLNKMIAKGDQRHTILVIGHSNTIPNIIRKLGVTNYPTEWIPDNEFDNLFLVRYRKHKARVIKNKYGNAAAVSAPMKSSQ